MPSTAADSRGIRAILRACRPL